MRKRSHKYKIGDDVQFRYMDGTIRYGEVTRIGYAGDNWDHIPTDFSAMIYTITVINNGDIRGYMVYPCVGEARIISANGQLIKSCKYGSNYTTVKAKPSKRKKLKKKPSVKSSATIVLKKAVPRKRKQTDLDLAIKKQQRFIDGKTK